jgi:hypothetical protein
MMLSIIKGFMVSAVLWLLRPEIQKSAWLLTPAWGVSRSQKAIRSSSRQLLAVEAFLLSSYRPL